jgi:hypothetical protein
VEKVDIYISENSINLAVYNGKLSDTVIKNTQCGAGRE